MIKVFGKRFFTEKDIQLAVESTAWIKRMPGEIDALALVESGLLETDRYEVVARVENHIHQVQMSLDEDSIEKLTRDINVIPRDYVVYRGIQDPEKDPTRQKCYDLVERAYKLGMSKAGDDGR